MSDRDANIILANANSHFFLKTGDGNPFDFHLSEGPLHHELVIGSTTYGMRFNVEKKMVRCPVCNVAHVWAEPERDAHSCCGASMPSPWAV